MVDFVDADSEKWRQLASGRSWPWSWLCRRESARLRAFDHDAVSRCDRCLFVSSAEARSFQELVPATTPKTLVIPNGVDSGYFAPGGGHPCPFAPGGPVLAFTGDMSYWPNEDAVLWFAREVLRGCARAGRICASRSSGGRRGHACVDPRRDWAWT
jgi:glycosyltransferase involved in cell wall biosynthesis